MILLMNLGFVLLTEYLWKDYLLFCAIQKQWGGNSFAVYFSNDVEQCCVIICVVLC